MVGIIGALEEEISELVSLMETEQTRDISGTRYYLGKLEGMDVVIAMSGVGKVNMAVCAQVMISMFNVDQLINMGVAGSLSDEIDICDIVVGVDSVEHDMDTSASGDPKGQVPRMDIFAFPCDPELIELAVRVNTKVNPDIRAHKGRVATGDQFVIDKRVKDFIISEFGAICCEMEGAAMAHTAYLSNVPCLIVRSISDKANGTSYIDYWDFKPMAVEHETRLILGMLKEMAQKQRRNSE